MGRSRQKLPLLPHPLGCTAACFCPTLMHCMLLSRAKLFPINYFDTTERRQGAPHLPTVASAFTAALPSAAPAWVPAPQPPTAPRSRPGVLLLPMLSVSCCTLNQAGSQQSAAELLFQSSSWWLSQLHSLAAAAAAASHTQCGAAGPWMVPHRAPRLERWHREGGGPCWAMTCPFERPLVGAT